MKYFDPKQESKHIIYSDRNSLYGYAMSKFLPTSGFKWIDPKEFYLNKYTSNSWKGCVPKVDLEYPNKLRKLHNDNPLAPDKTEIKREMLSHCQLLIIPIGNVTKLVPNVFDKQKYVIHYENLPLYLRLGLKPEKYISWIRVLGLKPKKYISWITIQSTSIAKTIFWIQHTRKE